jgi:hypothetical protein
LENNGDKSLVTVCVVAVVELAIAWCRCARSGLFFVRLMFSVWILSWTPLVQGYRCVLRCQIRFIIGAVFFKYSCWSEVTCNSCMWVFVTFVYVQYILFYLKMVIRPKHVANKIIVKSKKIGCVDGNSSPWHLPFRRCPVKSDPRQWESWVVFSVTVGKCWDSALMLVFYVTYMFLLAAASKHSTLYKLCY